MSNRGMTTPNSNLGIFDRPGIKYKYTFTLALIFFMFLTIRFVGWKSNLVLEDHDSVFYLKEIMRFLNFDLKQIFDSSPDSMPFYPLVSAIFSLPGFSVETSARLCSLAFSVMVFFVLAAIGNQIGERVATAIGLLILSFNAVLVFLSFSVLTEPCYIGLVYVGFWLFLTQYESPSCKKAAALGFVFGLAFLARTEGILYIVIIPFLQACHFLFSKMKNYGFAKLVTWTLLFLAGFSSLAAPQIYLVSSKVGRFAINGRQVWRALANSSVGNSYEEKIRGLSFSPSQINLVYVRSNPEAINNPGTDKEFRFDIKKIGRHMLKNFNILYRKQLGILIGPIGFILFSFGLLALFKSGNFYTIFYIIAFILFNFIGPLFWNVTMRHITVVAPLIILIEGIGIVFIYREICANNFSFTSAKTIVSVLLIFHFMGGSFYPLLHGLLRPLSINKEYNPSDLQPPLSVVRNLVTEEKGGSPRISSRKAYFPYYADGKHVFLPYASYPALVKYCNLNDVDFLFLEHRFIRDDPFLSRFTGDSPPADFSLLYSAEDSFGMKLELYRFQMK